MAKVITLTGLGETMDFAPPEAIACLESGGTPVWDDDGGMVCRGAEEWSMPVGGSKFDWKTSLKYTAVFAGGAGLGYFALNKKVGGVPSSLGGGAAALLGLLAFQKGGWLNKGTA